MDLKTAVHRHQSGKIEEAEGAYRRILAAEPANVWAIRMLGLLLQQTGRSQEGISLTQEKDAFNASVNSGNPSGAWNRVTYYSWYSAQHVQMTAVQLGSGIAQDTFFANGANIHGNAIDLAALTQRLIDEYNGGIAANDPRRINKLGPKEGLKTGNVRYIDTPAVAMDSFDRLRAK